MDTWNQDHAPYTAGVVVLHNGEAFRKLDDNDQSAPDHIGGGWELLQNTNVAEYQAIEASLTSYEQRVKDHKAAMKAKLAALGLDLEDLKALLMAS